MMAVVEREVVDNINSFLSSGLICFQSPRSTIASEEPATAAIKFATEDKHIHQCKQLEYSRMRLSVRAI